MERKFKHRKTGDIAYYKEGVFKQGKFSVEIGTEPSKDIWEEVFEEKDFSILSFQHPTKKVVLHLDVNNLFGAISATFTEEELLDFHNNVSESGVPYNIFSVKRTIDGETFTIGDRTDKGVIKSFELVCGDIFAKLDSNYKYSLHNVSKTLLYFTTEDGVGLSRENYVYVVFEDFGVLKYNISAYLDAFPDSPKNKVFSNRTTAEDFVLLNKPSLSLKEVAKAVGECNNTTYIDLDLLTEKLKKIIIDNSHI